MEVPQFAYWESHYPKRSRFSCSDVRSNGFCFALSCDLPTVKGAMLETRVFLSKSARKLQEFAEERGFEYRNVPYIRSNQGRYAESGIYTIH